jgi:hypothetical protein
VLILRVLSSIICGRHHPLTTALMRADMARADVQKNLRLALNEIAKFSGKTYCTVYTVSVLYVSPIPVLVKFICSTNSAACSLSNHTLASKASSSSCASIRDNLQP